MGDEQNILHRMLSKGDSLRDRYKDFDYSSLDSTQNTYLSRLSFFSKHRERVLRKFNAAPTTSDVKIAFLDQHSMKLGNAFFYDLESVRINYIDSFETMPVTTFVVGAAFFIRFAIRTPL